MHELLKRNLFLVKEHVGMFKAANNYDIFDPRTGAKILECREEKLGFFTRILRFSDSKRMTPFDIEIRMPGGQTLLRVRRGVALFLSTVRVEDERGTHIGGFKQKLFSIGGRFEILDADDRPLCTLKGKWTGWDFRFLDGEREIAHVSKKWSGAGRELFTSADNYMLQIHDSVAADDPVRMLILGAVMCIDMVLKE
jgi:uncharacterized protein YxjI